MTDAERTERSNIGPLPLEGRDATASLQHRGERTEGNLGELQRRPIRIRAPNGPNPSRSHEIEVDLTPAGTTVRIRDDRGSLKLLLVPLHRLKGAIIRLGFEIELHVLENLVELDSGQVRPRVIAELSNDLWMAAKLLSSMPSCSSSYCEW